MKLDYKAVLALGGVALVLYFVLKNEAKTAVATVASAVNPVNPNNVFAAGVNGIGGAVSGNKDFSLGSWFYDITHKGG